MYGQLHPPFSERCEISNSVLASNLAQLPPAVHSNCSEAVCLAATTLLLAIGLLPQCRDLYQYRKVPTHTILLNFSSSCRDCVEFAFWRRRRQKREKEEAYVRQVLNCFDLILLANKNNSPGQPKRSLRAATAVRYNYYVQLVAIERDWMRVPNLKSHSAR